MLTLLVAGDWAAERARRVLDAHACGLRAFHVVAGNRHDVYALAAAAKAQGLDPRDVLRSSVLARAFTAHQLNALLEDTLPVMMADRLAYVAVVDPLDLYANEDEVTAEEGLALLQRALAKLRILARRRPAVPTFLVQHPCQASPKHWAILEQAVEAHAVLDVRGKATQAQAPLTAWLPRAPAQAPAPLPTPVLAPEVMPLGPHHAHVPQPA